MSTSYSIFEYDISTFSTKPPSTIYRSSSPLYKLAMLPLLPFKKTNDIRHFINFSQKNLKCQRVKFWLWVAQGMSGRGLWKLVWLKATRHLSLCVERSDTKLKSFRNFYHLRNKELDWLKVLFPITSLSWMPSKKLMSWYAPCLGCNSDHIIFSCNLSLLMPLKKLETSRYVICASATPAGKW